MVILTLTPFALMALSTIITHDSHFGDSRLSSSAQGISEKESSARKSDRAWALMAVRGANVRANP